MTIEAGASGRHSQRGRWEREKNIILKNIPLVVLGNIMGHKSDREFM